MFALSKKTVFRPRLLALRSPNLPPWGDQGDPANYNLGHPRPPGTQKTYWWHPPRGSLTFTSVFRGLFFRKGPFGGSFRPRKLALNCKIQWEIDVASRNTRKTHRLCDVAFEKITKQCQGQKGLGIKHSRLATCGIAADCYFQTILKSHRN